MQTRSKALDRRWTSRSEVKRGGLIHVPPLESSQLDDERLASVFFFHLLVKLEMIDRPSFV